MRLTIAAFLLLFLLRAQAQLEPVFPFWKDDTVLRKKFHDETVRKQQVYVEAAGSRYAEDYKEVYKYHFAEIAAFWKSSRPVTHTEVNQYLQSIVKKIIETNPELKQTDARVVFTRDGWPNAVSMGDGTIAINAGLVVFMKNEAELVFVLCHELAHYFLDHSNKAIRQRVEMVNSEEFKKEVKQISKQEYKVGERVNNLLKKMAFSSHRHSRENEGEADRVALHFMKNTGYDCNGLITCLQLLDRIDDTTLFQPFVPESVFHFEGYAFKKKWTQKQSAIFGSMTEDDSPVTKAEKDSLKTHPDCQKRIELLKDSVSRLATGSTFLVDENFFHALKQQFLAEITEQEFRNDNLARNLYYSLQMLQRKDFQPLAVYSIARDLNILYQRQKDHKLGDLSKESRYYPADYNLLLRMLDRLRLEEIASINYFFCQKYAAQMSGYKEFQDEMAKAERTYRQYQNQ